MSHVQSPDYLTPYIDASERHGAGFGSLLWASPSSQAARFGAISELVDLSGKLMLDAGCGRADFLDYLIAHRNQPAHYVGLEALDALADAAELKHHRNCTIFRGDFVSDPSTLGINADIIVFCGSLNTLDERAFYSTIEKSLQLARERLVFNFLSSPRLAAARYLTWHSPSKVQRFLQRFDANVELRDAYIDGDCTISVTHKHVE